MHPRSPLARVSQVVLGLAGFLLIVGFVMLLLPGPGLFVLAAAVTLGVIGGVAATVARTSRRA